MGTKRPWQLYAHLPLAKPVDRSWGTYSTKSGAERGRKELWKRYGKQYFSYRGEGKLKIRKKK